MIDRRTIAAAIMMAVIAVAPAAAQNGKPIPNHPGAEARAELGRDLLAWAKTNVIPQLKTWKAKLDGAMKAGDLATLNGLRARATALKLDFVLTAAAMRDAWRDEDYDALKKERTHMKELGEQRKAIFQELKPIAETYRSTLLEIGAAAKPQLETWGQQRKEIVQKWAAAHKDAEGNGPYGGMGMGMGHMGERGIGKMDPEMRKKMMAARFMLWDGNDGSNDAAGQDDLFPDLR